MTGRDQEPTDSSSHTGDSPFHERQIPLFYDPVVFEGVMALSFVLPYELPLSSGLSPILIEDEYLQGRGIEVPDFDDAWMQIPFTCLTWWSAETVEPDPLVADAALAWRCLSAATGQEPPPDMSNANIERRRSAVVVMIPVKSREAAFTPPHADKLDPLTLAHWIVADMVRSVRIATKAPLSELHYPELNPIVPATFGSGATFDTLHFEGRPHALVLEHLADKLAKSDSTDHASAGRVFGQLTRGSTSVLIADHMSRAHAEFRAGDRRAAILSLAIACELMLDTALAATLWEDGKTPREAADVWAQSSTVTGRVKRLYASRLGGNWSLDGEGPMAQWRKQIVDVRNRIVHSGRFPTQEEVEAAGDAVTTMNTFVTGRLVAKWREYPRSMAVLAGPTTVRQHADAGQLGAVLEALERSSVFAVDFHRWRDSWLAERERP